MSLNQVSLILSQVVISLALCYYLSFFFSCLRPWHFLPLHGIKYSAHNQGIEVVSDFDLSAMQRGLQHSQPSHPPGGWAGTRPSHSRPCQHNSSSDFTEQNWSQPVKCLKRAPASQPMERGTSGATPRVRDTPRRNSWPKWPPVTGHPQVAVPCSHHPTWAGQCDHQLRKPEELYSHWP